LEHDSAGVVVKWGCNGVVGGVLCIRTKHYSLPTVLSPSVVPLPPVLAGKVPRKPPKDVTKLKALFTKLYMQIKVIFGNESQTLV
jgi:hypothetical protein